MILINNDEQEEKRINHIVDVIQKLLLKGSSKQFFLFFNKYHEADIAEALESMEKNERSDFFLKVNPELAADVLEEMEPQFQIQLISEFKTQKAAKYIEEMEPDDAVDLLEDIYEEDEKKAEQIMEALPDEEAEDIKELLAYSEGTAGSIMTTEFLYIPENLTVNDAITLFRKQNPPDAESTFYLYIVDDEKRLVGYTNLRNLLVSDPTEKINRIREEDPIKARVNDDQEKVSLIMQKYDLGVLPIIDDQGVLMGIITIDDMVDVVVEEATEDLYKLSGTSDIEESKLLFGKPIFAIKSRLPWLFLTIVGGIIASYVMKIYAVNFPEKVVSLSITLSFVPLLMGLAGNVGNQTATIIVRGLSTGMIREKLAVKYIVREGIVGAALGGVVGGIIFISTVLIDNNIFFSSILATSIMINSVVAAILGASLPLLFKRLNIDPAIASAPFISSTLDILGQIIYFILTICSIMYWFS